MLKAFVWAFRSEVQAIAHSWYKLSLLTLFPLLSFGIIVAIFYKGVASELPIVLVDEEKSKLSRALAFNINATATLDIRYRVATSKEALSLLKSAKAYALVIIPKHFSKAIYEQKQPKVTVMLNTQYILVGKIIKAALFESVASSAGAVEYVKSRGDTQNSMSSLASVTPINMQITPFFNTYKNYSLFLVSALIPSLCHIFIVITTLVIFGTLFKAKEEQAFFAGDAMEMKIVGKLLPYTFGYTLLGILFLLFIYGTQGWAFQGSWSVMIFALFLTVVGYQAVALTLFVSGFDYARALSLGAVYTAPAFAFLGVTFPVSSMNSFATLWRDSLPISYYMELQISQANYGVSPFMEVDKLSALALFWLLFIPVFVLFRRRLQK